jgi:hypothetical protein
MSVSPSARTASRRPRAPAPGAGAWLRALLACVALLAVLAAPAGDARAQSSRYTQPELEQLLAPIALYPDALLAQVLMASAYPAEVRLAADWLRRNPTFKDKGDAAVRAVDDQPWDPSVRSLVAFPSVLELMDANPDWTQQVGDAFIEQRTETMSAVQALRTRAQLAGNLQSNERWTVSQEDRTIVINNPAPQVVYVPSYNPTVVYGTWPYPVYPPVYLPPPPGYYVGTALASGIAFGVGIAVTNAIWGGFNWGRNDVNINVNHFNNIHVNNTQNYLRAGNSWQFDRTHRRDVPIGDRASRDRVQKQAVSHRDRNDYAGFDRDRPQRPGQPDPARPARPDGRPAIDRPEGRPAVDRPAQRPAVPDRRPAPRPADDGAFEGLDRPDRERPSIDRGQAALSRPSTGGPSARPSPRPARPAPGPGPAARPAPAPRPASSARPAPRPQPAARPMPAARPAAAPRPAPAGRPAPRAR